MSAALADKVMILTGAGGGQGRVTTELLLAAGAHVLLTDCDESCMPWAQHLGTRAFFMHHDVTNAAQWSEVVQSCVRRFGAVHGLVNNAGIAGRDTVASLKPEALHRYFNVNVVGALLGMQAVAPFMRATGGGSIVNIASISAMRATPGLVGYGVSKWALRGLTRNAAVEFAADHIRVNLLLPGAVDVAMIKDRQASAGKNDVAQMIPLRRVARAEEIAQNTMHLLSDAASYVTGAEIAVDGGWCA